MNSQISQIESAIMRKEHKHITYAMVRQAIVEAIVESLREDQIRVCGDDTPHDIAVSAIVRMEKQDISFRRPE